MISPYHPELYTWLRVVKIRLAQVVNFRLTFRQLFKFPPIVYLFWKYSQGLVDDTLNLKFQNFSQIKITIPGIDEQHRIAEVLYIADNEIEKLKSKLAALEKQKLGLMQKLLTGEVRVKL